MDLVSAIFYTIYPLLKHKSLSRNHYFFSTDRGQFISKQKFIALIFSQRNTFLVFLQLYNAFQSSGLFINKKESMLVDSINKWTNCFNIRTGSFLWRKTRIKPSDMLRHNSVPRDPLKCAEKYCSVIHICLYVEIVILHDII